MNYKEAVELVRQNNEKGFDYLYKNTYIEKKYLALKYMGNEDDAEDVIQEAYIKAWKNIDKLDNPDRFPSWFGTIVANTAKDELKKRKPTLFSEIDDVDEDITFEEQLEDVNFNNLPEEIIDQNDVSEIVNQLISTLSEEQKLCVLMFYYEHKSIKEIAQALDCSENTVKSRLNYGKKNLKHKVEELESKGYKIRGIVPIGILLEALLTEKNGFELSSSIPKPASFTASSATTAATTGSAAATTTVDSTAAAGAAASNAVKVGLLSSLTKKIIAVVLSIACVGGSATAVVVTKQKAESNAVTTTQQSTTINDASYNIDAVANDYTSYIEKSTEIQELVSKGFVLNYDFIYLDDNDFPELIVTAYKNKDNLHGGTYKDEARVFVLSQLDDEITSSSFSTQFYDGTYVIGAFDYLVKKGIFLTAIDDSEEGGYFKKYTYINKFENGYCSKNKLIFGETVDRMMYGTMGLDVVYSCDGKIMTQEETDELKKEYSNVATLNYYDSIENAKNHMNDKINYVAYDFL